MPLRLIATGPNAYAQEYYKESGPCDYYQQIGTGGKCTLLGGLALRGVMPEGVHDGNYCEVCLDYTRRRKDAPTVPEAGGVRNLLFHLYPLSGNGRWQWHVDQIKARLPLFNGRRVVAIMRESDKAYKNRVGAHPDGKRLHAPLDPPEAVMERLGDGFECLVIDNDPNLREVVAFEPLFSRVADLTGPEQVTLYAQGKGTTRPASYDIQHRWAELLWETHCDYWPVVQETLTRFPLAGSFKKLGRGWPKEQSQSDWHYSGSWLWFRNRDVFKKSDWKRIDQFWSGIEPWPSLHFPKEQAGLIFHEGRVPTLNMYHPDYVNGVVEPAYKHWRTDKPRLDWTIPDKWYSITDGREEEFRKTFPDAQNVLELGTLYGGRTAHLSRLFSKVVSVEGRESNLAIARARFLPNVDFIHGDLEKTDLPSADAIYCCGVLYHMTDPLGLLKRMKQASNRVFISTHFAKREEERIDGYAGQWVGEGGLADPLSGLSPKSFFLTLDGLLDGVSQHWCAKLLRIDRNENGPLAIIVGEGDPCG